MKLEILIVPDVTPKHYRWFVYTQYNKVLDEGVARSYGWALRQATTSRDALSFDDATEQGVFDE